MQPCPGAFGTTGLRTTIAAVQGPAEPSEGAGKTSEGRGEDELWGCCVGWAPGHTEEEPLPQPSTTKQWIYEENKKGKKQRLCLTPGTA